MTQKLPTAEPVIPAHWDARLILDFLQTPGFEAFDAWIDDQLVILEGSYKHVPVRQNFRRMSVANEQAAS